MEVLGWKIVNDIQSEAENETFQFEEEELCDERVEQLREEFKEQFKTVIQSDFPDSKIEEQIYKQEVMVEEVDIQDSYEDYHE